MHPSTSVASKPWKLVVPQGGSIREGVWDIAEEVNAVEHVDVYSDEMQRAKLRRPKVGNKSSGFAVDHSSTESHDNLVGGHDRREERLSTSNANGDGVDEVKVTCNKEVNGSSGISGAVDDVCVASGLSPSCGKEEEAQDDLGQGCAHESDGAVKGYTVVRGVEDARSSSGDHARTVNDSNSNSDEEDGCGEEKKIVTLPIELETACEGIILFLDSLCKENASEPLLTSDFHSSSIPGTSIGAYMHRFKTRGFFTGETLLVSLIMLLKYSFAVSHPVTYYSVHRLMITSAMLSAKMREDRFFDNQYYSFLGGIQLSEMNKLELRFCMALGWDLWIEDEDYETLAVIMRCFKEELSALTASFTCGDRDPPEENLSSQHEMLVKELGTRFWNEHFRPWKSRLESNFVQRVHRMEHSDRTFHNRSRERCRQLYLSESNGASGYGCSSVLGPAMYGRQMYHVNSQVPLSTNTAAHIGKAELHKQQQFGIVNRNNRETCTDHDVARPAGTATVVPGGVSGSGTGGYVVEDVQPRLASHGPTDASASAAFHTHNREYYGSSGPASDGVWGTSGGTNESCNRDSGVADQRVGARCGSKNDSSNNKDDIVGANADSSVGVPSANSTKWFSHTVRNKIQHTLVGSVPDEQQPQQQSQIVDRGLPWSKGERGAGSKRRKPDHYRDYR